MAQKTLTTSYLTRLTNANHDGVTQQISDRLQQAAVSNPMLAEATKAVAAARQKEDDAYRRYSGKDFASDDLKAADELEDKYMAAVRNILNGYLYLPESEPMRRKAELALQLFKDFKFSTVDGLETEARKTINMVQQWKAATEYTLGELGVDEWVSKANTQAEKVIKLVAQRVENESTKVKGELADARKATDQAIRSAYDIINALTVIQPSTELTTLTSLLFAIEDRARLYYMPGGKTSGGNPTPNPSTPDGSGSGGDEEDGGGGDDDTTGPTAPPDSSGW